VDKIIKIDKIVKEIERHEKLCKTFHKKNTVEKNKMLAEERF